MTVSASPSSARMQRAGKRLRGLRASGTRRWPRTRTRAGGQLRPSPCAAHVRVACGALGLTATAARSVGPLSAALRWRSSPCALLGVGGVRQRSCAACWVRGSSISCSGALPSPSRMRHFASPRMPGTRTALEDCHRACGLSSPRWRCWRRCSSPASARQSPRSCGARTRRRPLVPSCALSFRQLRRASFGGTATRGAPMFASLPPSLASITSARWSLRGDALLLRLFTDAVADGAWRRPTRMPTALWRTLEGAHRVELHLSPQPAGGGHRSWCRPCRFNWICAIHLNGGATSTF